MNIDNIIARMSDNDSKVQEEAINELLDIEMHGVDEELVAALLDRVTHGIKPVRHAAINAIAAMLADCEISKDASEGIRKAGQDSMLPVIKSIFDGDFDVMCSASTIIDAVAPQALSVEAPIEEEPIGGLTAEQLKEHEREFSLVAKLKVKKEEIEKVLRSIDIAIKAVKEVPTRTWAFP